MVSKSRTALSVAAARRVGREGDQARQETGLSSRKERAGLCGEVTATSNSLRSSPAVARMLSSYGESAMADIVPVCSG